jgi:hypothetical protein
MPFVSAHHPGIRLLKENNRSTFTRLFLLLLLLQLTHLNASVLLPQAIVLDRTGRKVEELRDILIMVWYWAVYAARQPSPDL